MLFIDAWFWYKTEDLIFLNILTYCTHFSDKQGISYEVYTVYIISENRETIYKERHQLAMLLSSEVYEWSGSVRTRQHIPKHVLNLVTTHTLTGHATETKLTGMKPRYNHIRSKATAVLKIRSMYILTSREGYRIPTCLNLTQIYGTRPYWLERVLTGKSVCSYTCVSTGPVLCHEKILNLILIWRIRASKTEPFLHLWSRVQVAAYMCLEIAVRAWLRLICSKPNRKQYSNRQARPTKFSSNKVKS